MAGPDLDLVHLEFPLDGGVLALQAGQPRLDVLIGGDEGKVGGRVDIVGGQRGGVPRHAAAAVLFQAPRVAAAASQQPQLPSSEQRLHHSEAQPEDRQTRNQLLTLREQRRCISVWGQPSAQQQTQNKVSQRNTQSKIFKSEGDRRTLWDSDDESGRRR